MATLVARGVGPELVLAAVAEEVGALFDADLTVVVRFEPDGEVTLVAGHGLAQPNRERGPSRIPPSLWRRCERPAAPPAST